MSRNEYIKHSAGLLSLMQWIEQQNDVGHRNSVSENMVTLNTESSSLFGIGRIKHPNVKRPFLIAQKSTLNWLKFISWETAIIVDSQPYLYLKTKPVFGDLINYADYPSFGLAILFDDPDKLQVLAGQDRLDAREFWADGHNLSVNCFSEIFSVPILNSNETIQSHLKPTDEVLSKQSLNKFLSDQFLSHMELQDNNSKLNELMKAII